MRVLLDADILIDVALARAPYVESAAALLDELERRPPCKACAMPHACP